MEWDINNEKRFRGAAISIVGTLISSGIALILAVPLAFGIAVFLTKLVLFGYVGHLERRLGFACSGAIYHLWHVWFVCVCTCLCRLSASAVQKTNGCYADGTVVGEATNGLGILAAGIILAFMVLPFIAAVMRDVFEITPSILRESAYGLGCTTWEVVRKVVLPYTQEAMWWHYVGHGTRIG